MIRRLVALAIVALAVTACSSSGVAQTKTFVSTLEPWSRHGVMAAGMHQRGEVSATCNSRSHLVDGQYECDLDQPVPGYGVVADPCYASVKSKMICFDRPGANGYLAIHLDSPLTIKPTGVYPQRPTGPAWSVGLADGTVCVRRVADRISDPAPDASYDCKDGTELIGSVNQSAALWTANQLSPGAFQHHSTVTIEYAVY